ncbi:hypothetical protein MAPG_05303 [Magnaporthiopsis poae ATCC 64411]|uniref:Uncharacterized protein n=1 Tax=Magnaporthiopsis poae (strain ATCC 64411 / 73-15) TaxID=644358 RepID=A0A0C4DZ15_MAGP6|nr:hypothetical protein MAPG_05303 [Magnaporthiopsis poae ATCC 64411]
MATGAGPKVSGGRNVGGTRQEGQSLSQGRSQAQTILSTVPDSTSLPNMHLPAVLESPIFTVQPYFQARIGLLKCLLCTYLGISISACLSSYMPSTVQPTHSPVAAMSSSPEFSDDESSTSSGPIFHLAVPTASVDPEQDGTSSDGPGPSARPEAARRPRRDAAVPGSDPDRKLYFVYFRPTNLPFLPSSEPMDPARDLRPWISGRFEVNQDYHVHPSRDGGKDSSAAPREPRRAPGGTLVTEAPRLPRQGLVLGELYTQNPDPINGGIEMHRAMFDVIVNADPDVANPEAYIIYNCKVMREWYAVAVMGRAPTSPAPITFTAQIFGGLMERTVPGSKGC